MSTYCVLNFWSRKNQFKCILQFKGENPGFILLQGSVTRVQGEQAGAVPRITLHRGPCEDASGHYREQQMPSIACSSDTAGSGQREADHLCPDLTLL